MGVLRMEGKLKTTILAVSTIETARGGSLQLLCVLQRGRLACLIGRHRNQVPCCETAVKRTG